MDPQATLNDLFQAIELADLETACDCLEALIGWLNKGGYEPSVVAALKSLVSVSKGL